MFNKAPQVILMPAMSAPPSKALPLAFLLLLHSLCPCIMLINVDSQHTLGRSLSPSWIQLDTIVLPFTLRYKNYSQHYQVDGPLEVKDLKFQIFRINRGKWLLRKSSVYPSPSF